MSLMICLVMLGSVPACNTGMSLMVCLVVSGAVPVCMSEDAHHCALPSILAPAPPDIVIVDVRCGKVKVGSLCLADTTGESEMKHHSLRTLKPFEHF